MKRVWLRRATTVSAALALVACAQGAESPAGAVVARVNGGAISVEQLHAALAASASATQALERAIDQELLVQRAIAEKIDRDPRVQRQLESNRRQLLAHAYLERAAYPQAHSTPEEIHSFYLLNPALFGERRIYSLRELDVADGGANGAQIRQLVAGG